MCPWFLQALRGLGVFYLSDVSRRRARELSETRGFYDSAIPLSLKKKKKGAARLGCFLLVGCLTSTGPRAVRDVWFL